MTTITISRKTKKKLETIKGKRSWDDLLNDLYELYIREKRIKLAREFESKFSISNGELEAIDIILKRRKIWKY